jgi:hypothetical protein
MQRFQMKAEDSLNLFGDILNQRFFGLLSGANKVQNLILVNFIDNYFGDSISSHTRDDLTEKLDDFIKSNKIIKRRRNNSVGISALTSAEFPF